MREFMLFVHVCSFALGALLALQAAFILPDEMTLISPDAAVCPQLALDSVPYPPGSTATCLLWDDEGSAWLVNATPH